MRRRHLLVTAGTSFAAGLAGCAGEEVSSTVENTTTGTRSGTVTGAATETKTQPASESDLITGLEIDGTEFVITLAKDKLEGASRMRISYPNEEDGASISEEMDTYRFDFGTWAEPGTWEVELLDDQLNTVTSAEYVAERNFSVSKIGTLSQLGGSGGSEWREYTSIQFTVKNDGPMPLSIGSVASSTSYGEGATESDIGFDVLTAGETADTDMLFRGYLGFTYRENAESRTGESYQGFLDLDIQPEGEESYPLTISFGNEINHNSEYGVYYIKPTEVNFRE